MTALHASLLGIVQGFTEFLPVSSSAHLILARAFFGWDAGQFAVAFDVACHVGTFVAVVVYFRSEVAAMTMAAADPKVWRGGGDDAAKLLRAVVIGTVPIAVVGSMLTDDMASWLRTPQVAAVSLTGGALVMLVAERISPRMRTESTLSTREVLGLGFAQAAALVPGVSRSGAVLTVAMLVGLRRERAARFAFLLGIPAVLAAAGKTGLALTATGVPLGAARLCAIGMASSAVVGYLAVKYFIHYVARHSLDPFAAYRLVLAAGVLAWAVSGS